MGFFRFKKRDRPRKDAADIGEEVEIIHLSAACVFICNGLDAMEERGSVSAYERQMMAAAVSFLDQAQSLIRRVVPPEKLREADEAFYVAGEVYTVH